MRLKCNHVLKESRKECGNVWDYEGKQQVHARCPDCLGYVKINECKVIKK